MIDRFSNEVADKIKYYVYRLIDPRNGQTFYVGKGKGNRVFAHAKDALKGFDKDVDYTEKDEDERDLKLDTIRAIKKDGLDVIYIIQTYNLDEKQAFLVESVFIDFFGLGNLHNRVKGHHAKGPINAITLQINESTEEFADLPTNPDYVIIKVKDYWVDQRGGVYEAARSAWKMSLNTAKKYKYVLGVVNGIVKGVFEVKEWKVCATDTNRIEFDGVPASKEITNLFINKKIPARFRKKGQASPFLYSKR